MGPEYVYIDWGSEFLARHSAIFPGFTGPGLTANIGWLGLQYILANNGSGYFPRRVVAKHLATGHLHEVPEAPTFTLPAYLVYPTDNDPKIFEPALAQIRKIAAEVAES